MPLAPQPVGRRERNTQNKLDRITAAAGELFAEHGVDEVMAIVRPVVECNRTQIDNGRTYLREIVFGDPEEPHHRDALALIVHTEEAIATVLRCVATAIAWPATRGRAVTPATA
jgi:hypothetical protein